MSTSTAHAEPLTEELNQVRAEIQDLEAQELALSRPLQDVRRKLAGRRARAAKLAHALRPIARISSDVLAAILLLACNNDRCITPTDALRVSRFWYKTAMECGGLWSSIRLSSRSGALGQAATYLKRAQGHAIDVVVYCGTRGDWGLCLPLLTTVVQSFHRVRTLVFLTGESYYMGLFFNILPAAAPSLTYFNVTFCQTEEWRGPAVRPFPMGAPQLTKLALHNISIDLCIPPPLSCISSFSWSTRDFPSLSSLRRYMPALTRIESSNGDFAEIQRQPQRVATVTSGRNGFSNLITGPLAFALMEPLAVLTLSGVSIPTFPQPVSAAIAWRLRPIHTLTLHNCTWGSSDVHQPGFFHVLDALATLRLVVDSGRKRGSIDIDGLLMVLARLGAETAPVVLPRLRRLEVRIRPEGGLPAPEDLILAIVRARATAGVPLATLMLLASHYSQMDPDVLAELREEVTLEIVD